MVMRGWRVFGGRCRFVATIATHATHQNAHSTTDATDTHLGSGAFHAQSNRLSVGAGGRLCQAASTLPPLVGLGHANIHPTWGQQTACINLARRQHGGRKWHSLTISAASVWASS